ncbi:hypothetical protein VKT23_009110 [Stygiomarasmius scandens]|uniref:Uncharacterized protein n=1 Tax=Marasmiellus scandens TaxID=2682957 RepID=A0ABR1JF38_9AGAR
MDNGKATTNSSVTQYSQLFDVTTKQAASDSFRLPKPLTQPVIDVPQACSNFEDLSSPTLSWASYTVNLTTCPQSSYIVPTLPSSGVWRTLETAPSLPFPFISTSGQNSLKAIHVEEANYGSDSSVSSNAPYQTLDSISFYLDSETNPLEPLQFSSTDSDQMVDNQGFALVCEPFSGLHQQKAKVL